MTTTRNASEVRPLTARSVLLSTLLGLDPPVLPASRLVATAGLLGIEEGTARVALSRMAAAGEVVNDGTGRYRLAGRLLDRQRRQQTGLHPAATRWDGGWHLAVVTAPRRSAAERSELRSAMVGARFAEWREGVWTRPDDQPPPGLPVPLAGHCQWLTASPTGDPAALAATLWDLDEWSAAATSLQERLRATRPALDAGDVDTLAPGFVLSAAVLRHLSSDPLLPAPLLPPGWPGPELRTVYDGWDTAFRRLLAEWHRQHR